MKYRPKVPLDINRKNLERILVRDVSSLSFAHHHALNIAHQILQDLDPREQIKQTNALMSVFEEWKNKNGIVRKGILSDNLSKKQKKLVLEQSNPWQCHPYAYSPLALFDSLFAEKYRPLMDFLGSKNWNKYEQTKAILILLSHDKAIGYQEADCICAGIALASFYISWQKSLVIGLNELAQRDFMRMRMKSIKNAASKEEKRLKILEAYKACYNNGKPPNHKSIAREYKKLFMKETSAATISRNLIASGISKK